MLAKKHQQWLDYVTDRGDLVGNSALPLLDEYKHWEDIGNTSQAHEKEPLGVVYRDQYFALLRDPVLFKEGETGGYLRLIPTQPFGVAILPVYENKVLLIQQYRHATRDWRWEIPRGFVDSDETIKQGAMRELDEEVKGKTDKIEYLGEMEQNTGILSATASLFIAHLSRYSVGGDNKEAIESTMLVDKEELNQHFINGLVTDSFTMCALKMAEIKGLF